MVKFIHHNYHRIILVALFLLQLGFIRSYLPVSQWFNEDPIYTDDYIIHYADALYKGMYLSKYKMLFGYNPYIRAGNVSNIFFSVDNFGWSLFVYLLPFLPSGLSFKLFFLLTLMGIPFIVYRSSKNFDLSLNEAVICSVLGTLFLHVSVCVDFLYWGTVSYILSCYLCLLISSFFYRFVKYKRIADIIYFTVLFSIGFWVHIFTPLHVVMPFAVCYILCFRKLSLKQHALVVASAVVVLALNGIWLIPCLIFMVDYADLVRDNFIYATPSLTEPINTYFFFNFKFNEYLNIPFPKSGIVDLLLLGTGVLGMAAWRKKGHFLKTALFAVTTVFLFVLSYYGSFWDFTASLTPLRFVIFMNIFLTIPAAVGLRELYDIFLKDKPLRLRAVSGIVVAYLIGTLLANPYLHIFKKKDFRLTTHVPPPLEELISWIKQNTSPSGRILIENSDFESSHQYYGTHLPYFFPLLTNREYIGNYSPYAVSHDAFATFFAGRLFRRNNMLYADKITEYTPEEVWPYMDLYNIKWIVVWSEESKRFFESAPKYFIFRQKVDKFFIYETNRPANFFLKGNGNIKAEINRIELTDLEADAGEIVIAYRWMKYLRTEPAVRLEKTLRLSDPGGFITLKNPPQRIVIYNSYRAVFSDWKRIVELFKNRL